MFVLGVPENNTIKPFLNLHFYEKQNLNFFEHILLPLNSFLFSTFVVAVYERQI